MKKNEFQTEKLSAKTPLNGKRCKNYTQKYMQKLTNNKQFPDMKNFGQVNRKVNQKFPPNK